MKISSKAFAIPILTAYEQTASSAHEQSVIIEQKLALRHLLDAVRIGIAHALELIFIL